MGKGVAAVASATANVTKSDADGSDACHRWIAYARAKLETEAVTPSGDIIWGMASCTHFDRVQKWAIGSGAVSEWLVLLVVVPIPPDSSTDSSVNGSP